MQEPYYIVEDAARLIRITISEALQRRFSYENIVEILEIEFKFLQLEGIANDEASIVDIPIQVPVALDEAAMAYYIIKQCAQKNIYLTFQELQEILDAEMIYLEQQGLIDEEGASQYLN